MSNPTLSPAAAEALARKRGCTDKVMLLGMRSATSKYGEFDDTAGLITPTGYTEFRFNTLPTVWKDEIACLQPGDYKWIQGLHGVHHFNEMPPDYHAKVYAWLMANKGKDYPNPDPKYIHPYWAYREKPPMTIIRDGHTGTETDSEAAPFMIDGHHSGIYTTSSAGCQTWPTDHWLAARAMGYIAMDAAGQTEITYSLHLMD
jgi:hypothetical protein